MMEETPEFGKASSGDTFLIFLFPPPFYFSPDER
jgi:hypothetical protein